MTPLSLVEYASHLSTWLREDALPFWCDVGVDRRNGGFFETVGLDGVPLTTSRRARVQPRQVYCFAEAGRIGWTGRWKDTVTHGLTYFDEVFLRDDGLYGSLASSGRRLIDPSFDLYNQAFALFAFAQVATTLPAEAAWANARAEDLLERIRSGFSHPMGGFEGAYPRRLPLCSNPHMHLFEAALAWESIKGHDVGPWSALADEIARLCMDRFIDRRTGALREFFDGDWAQLAGEKGRIVEPGHQFEWAWLLARWSKLRGNREALAKARRLFDIGVYHGVCPRRHVAVMALDDDFNMHDETARLWPQTEWIKAAVRLAGESKGVDRDFYLSSARRACAALCTFLDVPVSGLWRDKMLADGSFVEEPAPASSFYHIVCMILEFEAFAATLAESDFATAQSEAA